MALSVSVCGITQSHTVKHNRDADKRGLTQIRKFQLMQLLCFFYMDSAIRAFWQLSEL